MLSQGLKTFSLAGLALIISLTITSCDSLKPKTSASSKPTITVSTHSTPTPTANPKISIAPASQPPTLTPTSTPTTNLKISDSAIINILSTLPVKGRAPKTGYTRKQFGHAWADVDRNGCDTRNDILRRDLVDITYKNGSNCVVARGTLHDPYTGKTITFTRGRGTSKAVQIDHVVALSDAWQKGAQQLDKNQRQIFANDPMNLLAVDGSANQQKGDGDAATWLPANKAFRCKYVTLQVKVKAKYSLWVTQAEKDAITRQLNNCKTQTAPAPKPAPAPKSAPASKPKHKAAPGDVYYKNCAEARRAGAAPIYRGQPGYRRGLDRDHDGVACE